MSGTWNGPSNKARAMRFLVALKAHATHDGQSPEAMEDDTRDLLADLLADARHFCDREGLAFHELDGRAHRNYSAEVVEERRQKPKRKARKPAYVCDDNCRNIGCKRAHAQAEQSDAEEISDRGREDF